MDDDNFTQWLVKHHSTDSGPLGILAEMAANDRSWPHTGTRLKTFTDYLADRRLPPKFRVEFMDAWTQWRSRDRHW